jgi:hypothetical protein
LELWESRNTEPFEQAASRVGLNPVQKFTDMVELWLDEKRFDPAFDSAVRNWALSSPRVAKRIAFIDSLRMNLFEKVFEEMGYNHLDAMVRARVTYYHQVGYYTLDVHESKERRKELLPIYLNVLVGEAPLKAYNNGIDT